MSDQDKRRAAYVKGLRLLAGVLEEHPEVPLPYQGSLAPVTIHFLSGDDPRAAMAAAARAIPCHWRKTVRNGLADGDPDYFDLEGELAGGYKLQLTAYRDAVCTRVVTGTEDREVTEEVTPAVTRTVVRPVEVVTWECGPLLAPAWSGRCGECGAAGSGPTHGTGCSQYQAVAGA